ncbi:MAG: hypothetical protein ABFS10_04645 [Bacteroidota bacterium]
MPFFLLGVVLSGNGCSNRSLDVDVSEIKTEVAVERFDHALFGVNQDSLAGAVGSLYKRYEDFFDIYSIHIINIGQPSARRFPSYLSMFINDPTNREVYEYGAELFGGMEEINATLTGGFRHYLYHHPDSAPPRVVGYVSGFNQGLFTVDHFVGVSLDQYLGSDCVYYERMGTPRYLVRNKVPERIPVDVMMAWATQIYPYNDSVDNVLNRMIYKGMLAYFVSAMYPQMEESFRMGFTGDQMKWCRNNEKQMWTYLVEEKLLFSTDPLVIRKLTEDAPHTSYFTTESPGRAAAWQGLQIVRAYAGRNPQLSVRQILTKRDYQELLRESRYNP